MLANFFRAMNRHTLHKFLIKAKLHWILASANEKKIKINGRSLIF